MGVGLSWGLAGVSNGLGNRIILGAGLVGNAACAGPQAGL